MSILSFNEEFYLLTNTDVFAAVNAGIFPSGEAHYIGFGDAENRNPTGAVDPVTGATTVLFNNADYLAVNPDVQAAILNGSVRTALDHYVDNGIQEGRFNTPFDASTIFDASFYASQNPDVVAAINSGAFGDASNLDGSLFAHWTLLGFSEGRAGNGNISPTETLTINPDFISSTATNLIVNGPAAVTPLGIQINTFQSQDQIFANGGDATLNAILVGDEPILFANVQDVPIWNLSDNNIVNAATTQVNASISNGVTQINDISSQNGAAIGGTGLLVSNLNQMLTDGITLQAPVLGHSTFVTFNDTVVSGTADAIDVTAMNVGLGAQPLQPFFGAASGVTVNASGQFVGGFETVNLTSTGGTLNLIDQIGSDSTINGAFAAGATLPISGLATSNTLTVSGDSVTQVGVIPDTFIGFTPGAALTNMTTVDASGLTNTLWANLDPALGVAVTGGTGDDSLFFGGGLDATDTVVGGAGVNSSIVTSPWLGGAQNITDVPNIVLGSFFASVGPGGVNYDLADYGTATRIELWDSPGADPTFDNVDLLTVVAFTGTPGFVDGPGFSPETVDNVVINVAGATGNADEFQIEFGRQAGVGAFGGGQEQVEVDTLTIDLVETLHINSIGDNVDDPTNLFPGVGAANFLDDLFGMELEALVFTGTNNFALDNGINDAEAPNLILADASALDAALDIDFDNTFDVTILGGSGGDFLDGGSGNDIITGNDGDDDLEGQAGLDVLTGGGGDDSLEGGSGNDDLFGDAGDDLLEGDAGSDELNGGAGANTFRINAPGDIFDFGGVVATPDVAPFFDVAGNDVFEFFVGAFAGQAFGFTNITRAITAVSGVTTITGFQTVTGTTSAPQGLGGGFTFASTPGFTGAYTRFYSFLTGLSGTGITSQSFIAFAVNNQGTKLFVGIAAEFAGGVGTMDAARVFTVATASPLGSIDIPADVTLLI